MHVVLVGVEQGTVQGSRLSCQVVFFAAVVISAAPVLLARQ